ncbi:LysR family regulatory protein [Bordetella pertussis]|nr:LysR family regulatory protein [Bordetella pertussis]
MRDAQVVLRPFHPEVIVEVGALYSNSQPLSILASRFLEHCRAFQHEMETT